MRDKLIQHCKKIKMMWVPGHVGIAGNELADKLAKDTVRSPSLLFSSYEKNDLKRMIENRIIMMKTLAWTNYNHPYKSVNSTDTKAVYPNNIEITKLQPFIRLRIGHTKISHEHLLDRNTPPGCRFCNYSSVSTAHILNDCPQFSNARRIIFNQHTPSDSLLNIDSTNISKIYNYLKLSNILNVI